MPNQIARSFRIFFSIKEEKKNDLRVISFKKKKRKEKGKRKMKLGLLYTAINQIAISFTVAPFLLIATQFCSRKQEFPELAIFRLRYLPSFRYF